MRKLGLKLLASGWRTQIELFESYMGKVSFRRFERVSIYMTLIVQAKRSSMSLLPRREKQFLNEMAIGALLVALAGRVA